MPTARLRFGLLLGSIAALGAACALLGGTPPRPNVLVLFADDLRRDAVGAFGGAGGVTPNLDALAARGFCFERAYCMGSRHGAVCVPSRAMLLSGRGLPQVPDDLHGCATFPEQLRAAGYRTWMTGKWHNGDESLRRVFPYADAVFLGGMCDHFQVPLVDVRAGEVTAPRQGAQHSSELFADAAIAFLQRQQRATAGDEAPFAAYVAFTAPHDPRDAPPEWRQRFAADPVQGTPPLPANYRGQHGLNLGNATMTVRDENLLPWPRPPELLQQQLAEYRALVAHLDAQIGRILAALAATGLAANTLVVFAADHGLALGSHGLVGKQSLYEHSMGTPVALAGPGVPRGRSRALVYLFDLTATICAAAGAEPPAGAAGASLWPLLRGTAEPWRRELFTLYANSQRGLRDGRYELLRLPQIDRTLLFDLAADPDELHDLAGDPAHRATVDRLLADLRAQQQQWGDLLPLVADPLLPAEVDLTGRERSPDRWQPAWIRAKYFGAPR